VQELGAVITAYLRDHDPAAEGNSHV